jgi:hypothetical protein
LRRKTNFQPDSIGEQIRKIDGFDKINDLGMNCHFPIYYAVNSDIVDVEFYSRRVECLNIMMFLWPSFDRFLWSLEGALELFQPTTGIFFLHSL